MNHKEKWNKLLSEEDYQKKYIFSDSKEERCEPIEYADSGWRDYCVLVRQDKIIKQFIGDFKDKIVVEIGCGDGRMTEFFAKDFKNVYAIDISRTVIKKGKERLKEYSNIEWFESNGSNFPECQVDLIFSYTVFQHCRKEMIEANLKAMDKILSVNGIAKIQVRGKPISQDKWYSGDWYTPGELRETVTRYGYNCYSIWHDPHERRYLWTWLT